MKISYKEKFFIISSSFILCFASAEVFLRILQNRIITTSDSLNHLYKDIYQDQRDKPYVYSHKRNISVTLKKGKYMYTINTNSHGFRGKEDRDYLDKSVVFIGDSIIEGSSVEDNETISSVFEKKTKLPAINLGVGSYNTIHSYELLKEKYMPTLNTKLIILGYCLNDTNQNTYIRYFDPKVGGWKRYKSVREFDKGNLSKVEYIFFNLKEFLWSNSMLYKNLSGAKWYVKGLFENSDKLSNDYKKLTIEDDKEPYPLESITSKGLNITSTYLRKIKDFSREIGAEFLVVIFPTEKQLSLEYFKGERHQDLIIALLKQEGIPYIDLYKPIRNVYQNNNQIEWYYDEMHPYKEGHYFIGNYLSIEVPKIFPNIFR